LTATEPNGKLKPMRFFSLKWKLSIGFITMVLGFVGLYVALAKRTFESDKISSVLENQQRHVSGLAHSFDRQVEQMLFVARSILAGFDPATVKLSPLAQKIFWDHPDILALRLRSRQTPASPLQMEKMRGLMGFLNQDWSGSKDVRLTPLGGNRFLLSLPQPIKNSGPVEVQALFEYQEILGDQVKGQVMALAHDGRLLKRTSDGLLRDDSITSILTSLTPGQSAFEKKVENHVYLVAVADTASDGLRFASFSRKDLALGAMNMLFRRSMMFLLGSFFAMIILSLLFSNRLTRKINQLTAIGEKIGQGDFTSTPSIQAHKDEELATARLVTESLFPTNGFYQNGHVRLAGTNSLASEYRGEWWFYDQRGSELCLVIAKTDAQGIPAALITAVARSVFSVIKNENTDLKDIMTRWNRATRDCSNGKASMTAIIMRVNVELGNGVYISAGHAPPVLLRRSEPGKFKASYLTGEQSHALGKNQDHWLENRFDFKPGDRLLFDVEETRILSDLEKKAYEEMTPDHLLSEGTRIVMDYRSKTN
jgi:sigma-B regulation protein RsbU (phosphoserine phosphatase)